MNLMSNEIHSRIKLSSPRRSSRQLHFSEFFSGGGETRPELEISNYENDHVEVGKDAKCILSA
jgi:hypothetical protein